MTLLQDLIIALIAIILVTQSQNLDLREPLYSVEEDDLGYRPWEYNDTSTTWISLAKMGITSMNSMFRLNINNLQWLVMDDNEIQNIPSGAFAFSPELTYISLPGNKISKFETGAFSFLEKLQVLDLDRNPMWQNLDNSVFNSLSSLQRLYLRNCQLSLFNLPESTNSLSHLYLSNNNLQMFYASNESTLTHLHLNHNILSYVSLANFDSLIYLDLSRNRLTKIASLAEVSPAYYSQRLKEMWWGYHATEHSALYLDYASALQYLIVSFNEISRIESDSFLGTEALIHIDLTGNKISQVHAGTFNNLLELENVILDSNRITQINYGTFANLPNLRTISLKNNQINDIDEDAFTKLNSSSNEVYLYLDNNQIHTLRSGSFSDIKGLRHIGLSNNKIKTILSQAFVNLPNLRSLVIENQVRDTSNDDVSNPESNRGLIDSYAFFDLPNLTIIQIRGNEFTDVEAQAFQALPELTMLDLSNNSIAYISFEAFRDIPKIEDLYLSDNFLSEISPGTFPKQLKCLDLSGNNNICPAFSCLQIEELYQLEELRISGIIGQFRIQDLAGLPENLTVTVV